MVESNPEHLIEASDEERAVEIDELTAAGRRLLDVAGSQRWRPRELQAAARNGERATILSLAFWQLLNDGRLILDRNLRVRRAARQ
jgi:hypothetical protein